MYRRSSHSERLASLHGHDMSVVYPYNLLCKPKPYGILKSWGSGVNNALPPTSSCRDSSNRPPLFVGGINGVSLNCYHFAEIRNTC
ncbi:hypothetical protein JTE90_002336 [Oedothorax gibbosus]|uniref:Uncharacterized protein n=1 Tax=Oedothorax gibbosus TaxID=931172 RepID=A0AAV6UJL8_9ARAC|nr:hypothetical protein JTE90_002336 [Oedothorax gibbosus]